MWRGDEVINDEQGSLRFEIEGVFGQDETKSEKEKGRPASGSNKSQTCIVDLWHRTPQRSAMTLEEDEEDGGTERRSGKVGVGRGVESGSCDAPSSCSAKPRIESE